MDEVTKELVKLRHEQEEKVTQRLAAKLRLGYVYLLSYPIAPEVLKIIPKDQAMKHELVAYLRVGRQVGVATPRPLTAKDKEWLDDYCRRLGYLPEFHLCSASSFAWAVKQYDRLAGQPAKSASVGQQKKTVDFGQIIQSVKDVAEQTKKVSTSDLFSVIMVGAINTEASDIHIEPAEAAVRLRYRIDGVLQDVASLSHEQYAALLSRIKILAQLKLDLANKPQDGRFEYQGAGKVVDLRASTLPSAYGEVIVLRLLIAGEELRNLNQLEFNVNVLASIGQAITKPHGMIINTGPTGSGKTTTLYAILQELNRPGVKIVTIEDPVEYRLPGVNQTQVNPAVGYTFVLGLKGALRQDPDIIMVGEIRDPETAKIALQAALTGHLVITTLHANTAAAALPRLLEMGVEPFLLAGSINLIIAQRLVRKICPACDGTSKLLSLGLPHSEPDFSPSSDGSGPARSADLSAQGGTMPDQPAPASSVGQVLVPHGICPVCQGSGYRGRTPIVEALVPTHEFNELIARKATVEEFDQKAKDLGMHSMYEDGMDKVQQGITTAEEVERVTKG